MGDDFVNNFRDNFGDKLKHFLPPSNSNSCIIILLFKEDKSFHLSWPSCWSVFQANISPTTTVSSVQCAVKYTQWPPKAKTTWCKSNFTFHTWKSFPTYKIRGNYEEFTTIVFVAIFGKFGHWAATKTTRFCYNRWVKFMISAWKRG